MQRTTKIVSIANHKGGVGKTTTTACLSSILASQGYRVLAIDLDAQSNLTSSLTREEPSQTIYEAMTGRTKTLPVIQLTENLHLVPASLSLAMIDVELSTAIAREQILRDLLVRQCNGLYDYIFMDCPPALGLTTLNAFTASTDIIIPLVAEVLPFKGLTMIKNFISMVQNRLNPQLRVTGILLTRWENSKISKEIEERLRNALGTLVFQTKIRKNVRLAEAPLESTDIVSYAPKSNGAADYSAFTQELRQTLHNR